jgi:L-alanine-DL-glutamate epimerase-like enolase superfamily enzyme
VTRRLDVAAESWPIRGSFRISRGAKTAAEVVVVTLSEAGARGRGECVPYPRYGETVGGVVWAIEALRERLEAGLDRAALQTALPAGAARNALDCALWDLEAKTTGRPVHALAGLPPPAPLVTAYTLSLDTGEAMGRAAAAIADRPLLKLKLGGDADDLARVEAVRAARPDARLIVDANEAWTLEQLLAFGPGLAAQKVALIEQPLPAAADEALRGVARPVPLGADESCHTSADVARLAGLYDMVNIKLDKTGGLTEALAVQRAARAHGLGVMVGCMVATSLAMAPAALLAQGADLIDLDGPLLLTRDRKPGLAYEGATLMAPKTALWG